MKITYFGFLISAFDRKITSWMLSLCCLSFFLASCDKTTSGPNRVFPDTTSHSFVWTLDTFGTAGDWNTLRDICLFEDNTIWVTGEIHTDETDRFDSTGNWISAYNLVRWDGQQWHYDRILKPNGFPSLPLNGIWHDGTDTLVAIGRVYRVSSNKTMREVYRNSSVSVRHLWGGITGNLYGVGSTGHVVERIAGNWQTNPSLSDIRLIDIWGSPNEEVIWACGFDDALGSVLMRGAEGVYENVLEIRSPNLPHPPNEITRAFLSLWTCNADSIYLAAPGRVYIAPVNTSGEARENIWWNYAREPGLPPAIYSIRGNSGNDYFIAGFNQFVGHFNGVTWQEYPEIAGAGQWKKILCHKDFVCIVGTVNGLGIIARGNRIKN